MSRTIQFMDVLCLVCSSFPAVLVKLIVDRGGELNATRVAIKRIKSPPTVGFTHVDWLAGRACKARRTDAQRFMLCLMPQQTSFCRGST